nr:hypothetical protein bcere0006_40440 [Bacillus wiedmannii]
MVDIVVSTAAGIAVGIAVGIGIVVDIGAAVVGASLAAVHPFVDKVEPFA